MASLQSSMRLALLENRDALTSIGLAPWLMGLGWILCATLQEPLLLRHHSICVSHEAAYVAWAAVLVQLLLAKDRKPARIRLSQRMQGNVMALAACALGLALTLVVIDGASGLPLNSLGIIRRGSVFLLAWLPSACTVSGVRSSVKGKLILVALVSWSMVLSIHFNQNGFTLGALASVCLSVAAPLLLMPRTTLET